MKVLVIEDNSVTLESLSQLLSMKGYEVDRAGNGLGAFTRLPIFQPDALILDIYMPGMDGIQFLRQLRSKAEHRSLPVIIITAASEETQAEIRAEVSDIGGPEYFLSKPFDTEDLLKILDTINQGK